MQDMSGNEKMDANVMERDAGVIKGESARNREASEEKAAAETGRRPSRLKEVQPRDLCQMENFREVTVAMYDAIEGAISSRLSAADDDVPFLIESLSPCALLTASHHTAHRRLWEEAKTLHGDVNTNTIIRLDWPEGSAHNGPPNHGALVDFDIPYTIQAVRKLRQRWPPKMEFPRWYH